MDIFQISIIPKTGTNIGHVRPRIKSYEFFCPGGEMQTTHLEKAQLYEQYIMENPERIKASNRFCRNMCRWSCLLPIPIVSWFWWLGQSYVPKNNFYLDVKKIHEKNQPLFKSRSARAMENRRTTEEMILSVEKKLKEQGGEFNPWWQSTDAKYGTTALLPGMEDGDVSTSSSSDSD